MPVTITDPNPRTTEARPGADVTPTGLSPLSEKTPGSGQLTGSAGADRATLYDLQIDKDQVINLGAGDDVFVFGTNTKVIDLNGIVKMGDGNDSVYMNHSVSDYVFSLRSDGGIKIQYVGDPTDKGDAVTFYDAESFVFRNIDGANNYTNSVFTHDQLIGLINAGTPSM